MFKKYKDTPLAIKLMAAMVLGILAGAIIGEPILRIQILGDLFINLLKMGCIPLIMANLIAGIASLDGAESFGRISVKIITYYLLTTVLAATNGIIGASLIQPGVGLVLNEAYSGDLAEVPSIAESLFNMVPSNIFAALSNGSLDQVVVFSAFAGIAVLFCPKEEKEILTKGINALSTMCNKLISIVMGYAPIGIFALIACVVAEYGSSLAGATAKYVIAVAVCMFVHWCVYFIILFVMTRQNPLNVIKKGFPLLMTAVGTSSSMACVPVGMECSKSLGCDRSIYGFTIPLGSQLNKDGNAIMLTISLLFAAQAAGVTFTLPTLVNAVLIALLLTTGAGGIPGGGLVTIAIIIDTFSMPTEAVAIISGVFFIVDMINTAMNVYGDLVGTYIVDLSEKRRAARLGARAEVTSDQ